VEKRCFTKLSHIGDTEKTLKELKEKIVINSKRCEKLKINVSLVLPNKFLFRTKKILPKVTHNLEWKRCIFK